MKTSFWGFALAALSALSLSVPASGAVITQYTDRASWQAATSGRVDIDFTRTDATSAYYLNAAGVNFSTPAVNFSGYYNEFGTDSYWLGWSDASPSHNPAWQFTFGGNSTGGILAGGGQSNAQNGFNSGIIVNMGANSGIRMLALDFAALRYSQSNGSAQYPLSNALQLQVYEGGNLTQTIALSNTTAQVLAFIGIRTDGDISGIRLFAQNSATSLQATAILDNFSFGTFNSGNVGGSSGELPEPATFLTAAAACLLFSIGRYWKR